MIFFKFKKVSGKGAGVKTNTVMFLADSTLNSIAKGYVRNSFRTFYRTRDVVLKNHVSFVTSHSFFAPAKSWEKFLSSV